VLAVAALAAIGFGCVSKQLSSGNDFPIYHRAARTLLAGGSPYDVASGLHGYVYLPFFALALLPLALLPLRAAAWLWYALNVLFAVASLRAASRAVAEARGTQPPRWAVAVAVVPLLGFLHDNLALGQANVLLLLLATTGLAGALSGRGAARHGVLLGLAAALKMNTAVLVLPFLLRGRWRLLAGVGAGLAAAVFVPFLALGPARGADLAREWRAKVVAPAAAGTLQGSKFWDQSPQAALRRFLVHAPAGEGIRVNVAALSEEEYRGVSRAVSAGILALYAAVWTFAPHRRSRAALLLDVSLACCAALQVTGFNLKPQFVLLLLPAVAAAAGIAPPGAPRAARAALAVAALLLLASNPGVTGRAVSSWLLSCSAVTAAAALLAAVLLVLRFHAPRAESAAGRPATG
jgi:hypothetical protein